MAATEYLESRGKRAADVVVAVMLLAMLVPLWPIAAVAVRIGSPGPTFFRQTRIGRNGRPFEVLKLRTMTVDTRVIEGEETLADDPHITPAGRWLRRAGLDELPQALNVLRGEMSLVGPRPLLAWEIAQCSPRQRERLLAKPGITGLAQVVGRNRLDWADRIEHDVHYVEEANARLDAWILFKTIPVMLLGLDAYHAPTRRDRATQPAATATRLDERAADSVARRSSDAAPTV